MRVLLTVAALLVVVGAASLSLQDLEFHAWKLKFGKSYSSDEEESQRKMIWMENLKLVLQHNILADQGHHTYRLGMNQFGDMDNQEYQEMFKGCVSSFNTSRPHAAAAVLQQAGGADLPPTVDWRTEGYVTEVKNQMTCGSCWAFSATGALEAQMFKKTGKLISLSEQQLIDCSFSFGNNGCGGGLPYLAFKYIMSSRGLQSDDSYPYENKDGICRFNPQNSQASCYGYKLLPPGDEEALQVTVASIGPVSVAIDAGRHTFQLYQSGVYDEPFCSPTKLNHAVLVVGYGTEADQDYWLVKNSWGFQWGDKGYIKMSRNKFNQCGISTIPAYPAV